MKNKLKKYAVILMIIEKLKAKGSWCGETHIQKTVYFLEILFPGILDYQFILYKYGPFSFDLRDDLGIMESIGAIKVVPMFPYGPQIVSGNLADKIKKLFPKTLNRIKKKIEFVTSKLGDKDVRQLELLATSLYVDKKFPDFSDFKKAQEVRRIKPHISLKDALNAINELKQIKQDAEKLSP